MATIGAEAEKQWNIGCTKQLLPYDQFDARFVERLFTLVTSTHGCN